MGSALEYMHKVGFVHLDVKPENILLCKAGNSELGGVCKLGDFGMTLPVEKDGGPSSATAAGLVEGDSRYLSMEILQENYRCLPAADMFALGATVYELARISIGGTPLPQDGPEWSSLRRGGSNGGPFLPTKSNKSQIFSKVQFPLVNEENCYSEEFVTLLRLLMHPDPCTRPTAKQLLQHPLVLSSICAKTHTMPILCSGSDDEDTPRMNKNKLGMFLSQQVGNDLAGEVKIWKQKHEILKQQLAVEMGKRAEMEHSLFD